MPAVASRRRTDIADAFADKAVPAGPIHDSAFGFEGDLDTADTGELRAEPLPPGFRTGTTPWPVDTL